MKEKLTRLEDQMKRLLGDFREACEQSESLRKENERLLHDLMEKNRRLEVFEECVGVEFRDLPGVFLLSEGGLGYLVFTLVGIVHHVAHVGNVHHLGHFCVEILKCAPQDIGKDERSEIAYGGVVIDRRAAVIDAHLALFDCFEGLFAPGEGVE